MHPRQISRDPGPSSLDDRAFPTLLASVVACLALIGAASITDTTSIDLARPAPPDAVSYAVATLPEPASMPTP